MRRPHRPAQPIERAKSLRREMTEPERKVWNALRARRLAGLKFRRQFPVEGYIADFACLEKSLIVEIDGDSHMDRYAADKRREEILKQAGWRIVRIHNDDALQNLEGALIAIIQSAGLDPVAWQNGAYGQLPEGLR